MNKTRSFINGMLVCGVGLAVASVSAQTPVEQVVKVVRIVGAARYSPPGSTTMQDLATGVSLKAGSVLQSGIAPASYVDIMIGSPTGPMAALGAVSYRRFNVNAQYAARPTQTVIRLYANTALGIDKMVANETGAGIVTETELDLRKGHIMGNLPKLTVGSEFRVRYPKGVATIRGMAFDMTVEYLREVKEGEKLETVPMAVAFSMASGSGTISYADPQTGAVTTQVLAQGQAWNSGTPSVLAAIPPGLVGQINTFLSQTGGGAAPPAAGGVTRAAAPDHTQSVEQTTTSGP
jgi:hypothetical protein